MALIPRRFFSRRSFSRRPFFSWVVIPCASLILLYSTFSVCAFSQIQSDVASKRRLVQKTAAAYPPLARNMALEGVVRLDAVVAPDGSVKSVSVVGGHPVLAQAAMSAVRQWKWERSSHESREPVEVKFARSD